MAHFPEIPFRQSRDRHSWLWLILGLLVGATIGGIIWSERREVRAGQLPRSLGPSPQPDWSTVGRTSSAPQQAAEEPASTVTEDPRATRTTAEAAEPRAGANGKSAGEALAGSVPGDGSHECPEGYPVKGNSRSMIYHLPGQSSYAATVAEIRFATAEEATAQGFRPRRR